MSTFVFSRVSNLMCVLDWGCIKGSSFRLWFTHLFLLVVALHVYVVLIPRVLIDQHFLLANLSKHDCPFISISFQLPCIYSDAQTFLCVCAAECSFKMMGFSSKTGICIFCLMHLCMNLHQDSLPCGYGSDSYVNGEIF